MLMRGWMTAPPAAPRATQVAEPAPAAGNDHFSPMDSAPVYAPEIPVTGASGADASGTGASVAGSSGAGASGAGTSVAGTSAAGARAVGASGAGASVAGTSAPGKPVPGARMAGTAAAAAPSPREAAAHPVNHPDPVLTGDDYQPADEEVLPTINEINLTGAQGLPELHLDVHVFATKAADRFVYINMRKYHEGAALEEGPTVERIRRDGVILNYQGVRFLLPRQ
jgi:hypothetical protein